MISSTLASSLEEIKDSLLTGESGCSMSKSSSSESSGSELLEEKHLFETSDTSFLTAPDGKDSSDQSKEVSSTNPRSSFPSLLEVEFSFVQSMLPLSFPTSPFSSPSSSSSLVVAKFDCVLPNLQVSSESCSDETSTSLPERKNQNYRNLRRLGLLLSKTL